MLSSLFLKGNLTDITEGGVVGSGIAYKGTVDTEVNLPSNGNSRGDAFINLSDNSLFIWNGNSWDIVENIVGPPGQNGLDGTQFVKLGDFSSAATLPSPQTVGTYYECTANNVVVGNITFNSGDLAVCLSSTAGLTYYPIRISNIALVSGTQNVVGEYLRWDGSNWSVYGTNGSVSLGRDAGINQGANCVSIGPYSGQNAAQNSVSIGLDSGKVDMGECSVSVGAYCATNNQGATSVAIGCQSANLNQGDKTVAVGLFSGYQNQSQNSVAVGNEAGKISQGECSVSVGAYCGTSNQGLTATAVGCNAGNIGQGDKTVAVGLFSGYQNQSQNSVAVGNESGKISQGECSVSVGAYCGTSNQGATSVAVGCQCGNLNQGSQAVAVGLFSGNTSQGVGAVSIGSSAGKTNQSAGAVSIGLEAGKDSQGEDCIAIGANAGRDAQPSFSTVLNSSGKDFNSKSPGFYVYPMRSTYQQDFFDTPLSARGAGNRAFVLYNKKTGELVFDDFSVVDNYPTHEFMDFANIGEIP